MINEIDKKYMLIALEESKNANCIKGKVGAIIVKENRILGKGNNSVPNGTKPCTEKTCIRKLLNLKSGERQELCKVVHAEQNAILNALFNKEDLNGSALYVTKSPCMICSKILINAGIKRIVYANKYPDEEAFKILAEVGISTYYFPL